MHQRNSRRTFILAAIGSAAGLGNLRRFPFQVYDNGGLVFLVVYFVMLFIIGLGLLAGEIAFGQMSQKGGAMAFGSAIKAQATSALERLAAPTKTGSISVKRPAVIGRVGALTALTVLTYYSVVIGRSLDYLWYSLQGLFTGVLPWAGQASEFFYTNVLQLSETPESGWGMLSIPVLIATILVWGLIYWFTRHSAKSVGKVVWITATLPFIFLALLMVRVVTLPGATLGFEFLAQTDWSRLTDTSVWLAAAGQIFFSLSIGFGMMVAYASMKPKNSEVLGSTLIVLLGDTITSILSAVTVFGTLGFMAQLQGVSVGEVSGGGPGLAFITIPEALAQIPVAPILFAVMFFGTVFFLAIDSAMAMVETGVISIRDYLPRVENKTITKRACLILGVLSLLFVQQNGLYLLDIIDSYINKYMIVGVAIAETIVFLRISKRLVQYVRETSSGWALRLLGNGTVLPVLWAVLVVFLLYTLISALRPGLFVYDDYNTGILWYGVGTMILILVGGGVLTYFTTRPTQLPVPRAQ